MSQTTKKRLHTIGLACVAACALTTSFGARAVIINPILGLDIGGTLYDVTFHDDPLLSFNGLWDQDDDGSFGGGTSVFSAAPTFWHNQVGAEAARDAIISVLGILNESTPGSDGFIIPIGGDGSYTGDLSPGFELIAATFDRDSNPSLDVPSVDTIVVADGALSKGYPLVSFAAHRLQGIPSPFTPALLVPGLIALAALRRRKARRVP